MKKITKSKTTELIVLAHDNNKLIVCRNREEAHRIFHKATEMKLNIHLPITYDEFINKRYSERNITSILIDNVDMLVQYISKVKVEAITLSLEDEGWS